MGQRLLKSVITVRPNAFPKAWGHNASVPSSTVWLLVTPSVVVNKVRIVLDTNVLVAGLLSPFGPCGEIVRMVSSGEFLAFYKKQRLTTRQTPTG